MLRGCKQQISTNCSSFITETSYPLKTTSHRPLSPLPSSLLLLYVCLFNLQKTLHAADTFFPGSCTCLPLHTPLRILTAWPCAAACISVLLSHSCSHYLDSSIHPFPIQASLSMTAIPNSGNIENFSVPKRSLSQFEHRHIEGYLCLCLNPAPALISQCTLLPLPHRCQGRGLFIQGKEPRGYL